MRIVFMGTPDFCLPTLEALHHSEHDLIAIYCQPPRKAGRGQSLRQSPVQQWACAHNYRVLHPKSLKNDTEQAIFKGLGADIGVVAAYGLILPQAILDVPRLGCVNIHASLLPHLRGAAPIIRAIQAQDTITGITTMQMDAGLDTGPILEQQSLDITPQMTGLDLHDALAQIGANLILTTLLDLEQGTLSPKPQPLTGASYAHKLQKVEGEINWSQKASTLEAKIRAFTPWPGTWFMWNNDRIKLLKATLVQKTYYDKTGTPLIPGTIVEEDMTIACGQQSLQITHLQRAGKKPLTTKDFLQGIPLVVGDVLPLPQK